MLFPGSKGIGPVAVGSVTHYQTLIYKPIQVFLGLRCAEVDILCQLFCPGRLMFVQIAQNRRLFIVGYRRFIVVYRRFIVGYLLYPALVFLGLLVVAPVLFCSGLVFLEQVVIHCIYVTFDGLCGQ